MPQPKPLIAPGLQQYPHLGRSAASTPQQFQTLLMHRQAVLQPQARTATCTGSLSSVYLL